MPTESGPSSNQALNSWKEIAQHFGRDVRTVQRWESEEGLPVRRHLHQQRSSVYAYAEELDAWWQERGESLFAEPQEGLAGKRWLRWGAAAAGVLLLAAGAWTVARREPAPASAPAFRTVALDGAMPDGALRDALTGDLNGDGKDDLVFAAGKAKELYIVFGGSLPAVSGNLPERAGVVIRGPGRGWLWVRQVGDFNGDGLNDLLIGHLLVEPESFHATGPNYLVWGRREWPREMKLPGNADVTLRFDWTTNASVRGCNPAGGADLNGDGMADLLLAAPEYGEERKAAGSVFVLFGRREWPRQLEIVSSSDLTIRGSRSGEGLGHACAVGDFNGDAKADLAVFGGERTLWNLLGGGGRTYLFLGRKAWPAQLDAQTDFDLRVEGSRPKVQQHALLLADLNGDHRDDLVFGRPSFDDIPEARGEIHVWFGGEKTGSFSVDQADVVIQGDTPGGELGFSLASPDVDGDGLQDLIVTEGGFARAYLLYGRREWKTVGEFRTYAPVRLFQGAEGIDWWQIGTGDFDGDALPELVFSPSGALRNSGALGSRAWVLKPYLPVRVDLRPGTEPNVVLAPRGTCAVRVYGFSASDGDQVEAATLRMAGAPPTEHVRRDYDGDRIADIQAYFDTGTLKVSPRSQHIALTGRTRAGLPVGGTDTVVVVRTRAPSPSPTPTAARR